MEVTTFRFEHDHETQWKNWSNVRVTAQESAVYFCIRRYSSRIVNETLVENSTEVAAVRSPESW